MELRFEDLTLKKERFYFCLALIISVIAWVFVCLSIVGIFIALGLALCGWLVNGLLAAYLKSECVRIDEKQLPSLYKTFTGVCEKLNLKRNPHLYILQSGGNLNAFAMRHSGRDFVVLFSDLIEAYGQDSDEIKFLIGHELGHIHARHILKRIFLSPGIMLPLLGAAYLRQEEASSDRYGAYAVNGIDGAINAMMILSGGKVVGKTLDAVSFSEQAKTQRGFFVSWHELISGYPTLSQRVASLLALKEGTEVVYHRNPFAYFFALFSFGGMQGAGGNVIITVFIVAMLCAIAVPNFLRARIQTNESSAKATLSSMRKAVLDYAAGHNNQYPYSDDELISAKPAYLSRRYCGQVFAGYRYHCSFSKDSFTFKAFPLKPGTTGTREYFANKDGVYLKGKNPDEDAENDKTLADDEAIATGADGTVPINEQLNESLQSQ